MSSLSSTVRATPIRRQDAEAKVSVSEIFGPTIQGEGALIGRPTMFVRTGGCDYRCSWCDTDFAVDPAWRGDWQPQTAAQILDQIETLSGGDPVLITLSGGNPALQPLGQLIEQGKSRGHSFAMETQGSVARDWFAELHYLTLSPKPPSSGMQTDWEKFQRCLDAAGNNTEITLKVVVFDDDDYAFAREISARYPDETIYLQVGNPNVGETDAFDTEQSLARMRWLVEKVTADRWFEARVLPQMHALLWGNERRR